MFMSFIKKLLKTEKMPEFKKISKKISKKNLIINFALFSLIFLIPKSCLTSYSKIESKNNLDLQNKSFTSDALASLSSLGLAYVSYDLSNQFVSKILDQYDGPTILKKPIISNLVGAIVSGTVFFKTLKYLSPAFYLLITQKDLSSNQAKLIFRNIELYLKYLTVLKVLHCELQTLLGSLDTEKYHIAGIESRLQILDAGLYNLKKNSIISELEHESRYSQEYIEALLANYNFNSKQAKEIEKLSLSVNKQLQFLSNPDYKYDRKELLDMIQIEREHEIYDLLSEYFIHSDIFVSGFNRGIAVIDEAHLVNMFAKKLKKVVSSELYKYKKKLNKEINKFMLYKKLEDAIKPNL